MAHDAAQPAAERRGPERRERLAPLALRAFLRTFVTISVLVVIFGYGWRITEINLGDLARNAPRIAPIVRDLLTPDVLERRMETQSVTAAVRLPCPAGGGEAAPAVPAASGPYLTVERGCVAIGERLKVEGFGLRPSSRGFIRWRPPEGAPRTLDRVTTDGRGHFQLEVQVPEVRPSATEPHRLEVELQWGVGLPYPSEALLVTLERMLETVFLALMATAFAIVAAIPLSFLAARNLMTRNPVGTLVYYGVRTILNILRAIEPLIMAIIFAVWVGIGPFAGVLALAVHSVASLGKLYSEAIENIDPGPIEAVTATGANPLQVIVYAVIPQIVPPYVSFTIYRWDINVRMSTVIGFVGGGGIGFVLQQWINLFRYRQAGTAVWAIAIVVAVMDYASARVRERMV